MWTVFFKADGMNQCATIKTEDKFKAIGFVVWMGYKPYAVKQGETCIENGAEYLPR